MTWAPVACARQVYPAGVELYSQGDRLSDVLLIEEGLVKMARTSASGRQITLRLRGRGHLLGVAAIISNEPAPTDAVTLTRCQVRRIFGEQFLNAVRTNAERSWQVHRLLAREECDLTLRAAELGYESSRWRLEEFLSSFLPKHTNGGVSACRIALPLKRYEIASLLGITPEHLSRIFHRLEQEGVVLMRKGWLVIPDCHKLISSHSE